MRYEKIIYNGQMQNEHFMIVIHHSSLVKCTKNAARVCGNLLLLSYPPIKTH